MIYISYLQISKTNNSLLESTYAKIRNFFDFVKFF
nr:MAG TPA: hypothetical protein [Crassvirales sp.]